MKLETTRLVMRPIREEDASFLYPLINDAEVVLNLRDVPHPYPENQLIKWIRAIRQSMAEKSALEMAIVLKENNRPIGICALNHLDWNLKSAELGYWLGRQYWAHGYMTESVRAIVQFGFVYLGLERIYAHCITRNIASARVLRKAGLKYEGLSEHPVEKAEGLFDVMRFGIMKFEYQAYHESKLWLQSVDGIQEWLATGVLETDENQELPHDAP